MSLFKFCGDCSKETDCEWCEVCSSFKCHDCDPTHDCLADCLTPTDEQAEQQALTAQFEAADDEDGGHA